MEVMSQRKNTLMKREEAWVKIDHSGKPTPPRKDIITEVAKHFKAKEDAVIIDKIFSETGIAASKVKVLVYAKADDVPKAKLDKMKIRMGLMKKLKKGEQPAPQPAAPAADTAAPAQPAESKKDEAKAEPKPAEEAKPEEKKEEKPAEPKPAEAAKPAESKKDEAKAEAKPAEEKKEA